MSDRPGLSIFDDPEDNGESGADEATQVIPRSSSDDPHRAARPAAPPAGCPAPAAPGPRPRRPSADRPSRWSGAAATTPPPSTGRCTLRRREGRPRRQPRRTTKRQVTALEQELAALREQVSENDNPTYAGLGGRASEMLRLAEEQSDEVLRAGPRPGRRDQAPGDQGRRRAAAPRRPATPRTCGWSSSRSSTRPAPARWPRSSRSARWRRPRPTTCSPPPSARASSSGWPPSRRPTRCARAPSATPSRPGPPPTARSRRPAARSRWRRSG